jgi:hypothetical protein
MKVILCHHHIKFIILLIQGHTVAQLVETLRYKPEGCGLDSLMVSLEFSIDIMLLAALWSLEVDSASNRNEYQKHFLGRGKCGQCVGLTTLPPSCADCLEIWELQPSWNLQGLPRSLMGLLWLSQSNTTQIFLVVF